ncbi:hydroxysteroid dehydrogenase-like protein 3 [Leptotrombidium deliense]|uniref:Hydroxysteroid dehydrogenase-like protein 3 n=1 Tax=Leptotrombidium deliense TaxID=299467 RepID=A0A443STV8_9ACAR|nr:hydroxysteroid dehydrogenase-like protein 3 [Leptotrombidium deliense]
MTVVIEERNNNDYNAYQNIGKQLEGIKTNVGILINNANISVKKYDEYLEYSDHQVVDTIRANIISVLLVTKAVLPFMVENKKGLVLNITSPTGCQPLATSGFFNATKEFVDFFGKTLIAEYSKKNITVQTLNPGFVSDGFSAVAKCCFCFRCFLPTPQRFVSSAIATIGRGEQTSGYWGHAVLAVVLRFVPAWLHSSVYWIYNKFSGSGGGSGGNKNNSLEQEASEMLTVVSDITKRDE